MTDENKDKVEENPYDMHNFDYQRRHIEHGKRMSQLIDCCDICIMTVLKHLIHVFLVLGCCGLVFTVLHTMNDQSGSSLDPYEIEVARESKGIVSLMRYHPVVYGLNKTRKTIQQSGVLDAMNNYYAQYSDAQKGVMIHPLYVALQKRSKLNMLLTEPFDIKDHEYDYINKPIKGKAFYQKYMSKSLPCVFRQEAKSDSLYKFLEVAQTKQQIDETLEKRFQVKGIFSNNQKNLHPFPVMTTKISRAFGKSGKFLGQKSEQISMPYKDYVENRNKFSQPDYTFFIDTTDTIYAGSEHYKTEYDPTFNPSKHIMNHITQKMNSRYIQWVDFDGRKAKRLEYEQHICVFHGIEQFKIVSPIYRKNIYVNVFDGYHNHTTPVDFFNVNYAKYPLVAQFNFIDVTLHPGDCMYVPAYYYMQSKTLGTGLHAETIMISEQFSSHSKFVDVMMEALENELVTDQERHKYEKAFDGALQFLNQNINSLFNSN